MVNCNPETVSTDYDTSDRLYFEPLTFEDVMHIVRDEKPDRRHRSIRRSDAAQSGAGLQRAGVPIIGTSPESIDLAEDRKRFGEIAARAQIPQPENGTAVTLEEAAQSRGRSAIPCWSARPMCSGGRAMVIVYDEDELETTCTRPSRFRTTVRC